MAQWQDEFAELATAWAAVRGLEAAPDGDGVRAQGADMQEFIYPWPGTGDSVPISALQSGAVLTLVTANPREAADFAASQGLAEDVAFVLLTVPTADLDDAPPLPENAGVAQAPLEFYDLVEVAVFDTPVASGRIRVEDDVAMVGGLQAPADDAEGRFEPVVLAALADEAFVHGVDTLSTVVTPEQVARYVDAGWTVAAHVASYRSTE